MPGKIYGLKIRGIAEKLRSEGKTYSEIGVLLHIPKSTLSLWLGEKFKTVFSKEVQAQHLARIRVFAAAAKKRNREQAQIRLAEKIDCEARDYPWNNIGFYKSILSALYWAEGAKYEGVSGLTFVNTDPRLMALFVTLLRKCYIVDEKKMRVILHLHHYHNLASAKKFWSELLAVPLDQFNKTYWKKRSKTRRFRKNFMGICMLTYLDSNVRKEIMELARVLADKTLSE